MWVLEVYEGYLHGDGYEAYETLAAKMSGITQVGDRAHVRRKFDEAIKGIPKDFRGEIKVKFAFDSINELFGIEREDIGEDDSPEDRLKIRREKSKPLIEALGVWADETAPTLPSKTLSGMAARYMLECREKLIIFLSDAILTLDTSPVEGLIRPFAVGIEIGSLQKQRAVLKQVLPYTALS